jgi:hypothetical protein
VSGQGWDLTGGLSDRSSRAGQTGKMGEGADELVDPGCFSLFSASELSTGGAKGVPVRFECAASEVR